MSDIQFNEEQLNNSNVSFEEKNPKMVQLLINWGLVKDGKSANIVLIFIAIIFFGTSLYFFLKFAGIVS